MALSRKWIWNNFEGNPYPSEIRTTVSFAYGTDSRHFCAMPEGNIAEMMGACEMDQRGRLWVNVDYDSYETPHQVNFCPWCGLKAVQMMKHTEGVRV